jgi:HK97 family phage prohead protease
MELETRSLPFEFREDPGDARSFTAEVCKYGVGDSHGTSWVPGVFTDSLRAKLPKILWAHDSRRIIGRVTDYRDGASELEVTGRFGDFDAMPDARMAHHALKEGLVDEFSFGFVRQADKPDPSIKHGERKAIVKARMFEVSPVVLGSIPGTRTLAVRAALNEDFAGAGLRAYARTPHPYKQSNGDGSVCEVCGGQPDIKAHERALSAVEIRDLATRIAAEPVAESSTEMLLATTDRALDAAIALIAGQDLTRADPWVGQLAGLVLSADAHADAALDALGIPDTDDDARALTRFEVGQAVTVRTIDLDEGHLDERLASLGLRRPPLRAVRADDAKKPYGDVTYADPGYQDDKKKRYPLDTESHVRSAWSYINQQSNASKYSSDQLDTIKSKIKAAARKLGIEISDDAGKG